MQNQNQIELFASMPQAGSRTYLFEEVVPRRNKKWNNHLTISPKHKKKVKLQNNQRVMLFKGYAKDFSQMFSEAGVYFS